MVFAHSDTATLLCANTLTSLGLSFLICTIWGITMYFRLVIKKIWQLIAWSGHSGCQRGEAVAMIFMSAAAFIKDFYCPHLQIRSNLKKKHFYTWETKCLKTTGLMGWTVSIFTDKIIKLYFKLLVSKSSPNFVTITEVQQQKCLPLMTTPWRGKTHSYPEPNYTRDHCIS